MDKLGLPAIAARLNADPGLAAILDPSQDGFHDTHPDQPEPTRDLDNTPRVGRAHIHAF